MPPANIRLAREAIFQAILSDGTPLAVWCMDPVPDLRGRVRVVDARGQQWWVDTAFLTPMADANEAILGRYNR